MRLKSLLVVALTMLLGIISWVYTPSASALTQIKLTDVGYKECPPELAMGAVTSGATNAAN